MTEIKMENRKSNVSRNDNKPSFAGASSSSFLGLTRESLGGQKDPRFRRDDREKRRQLF